MLAPEPFFEPRGTPFSVLGRLRALTELGHEVDLLTYHLGNDLPIPGVIHHRTPRIGFIKTVKIGPSWKKVFLDSLLFIRAFRLLQKGRYDLLHTHEEAGFFGILLAKIFDVRHIYDMHSSLPEQLSNFRYTRFRPFIRLFEWIEKRVVNSSDAIITICPALAEHVKKINSRASQVMIENVPTEQNHGAASIADEQSFKAAYPFLDGHRIVLYTGTFEPYQGLDLLVTCAERVLSQCKDVMFLMVGGRPDQVQYYRSLVKEHGLSSRFHFTGARPPGEVPLFEKYSHILVSPRTEGTNTPLKIYSYLQSGKPIVATNLYTHTQVLNPDVALLVEPDPEAFAQGIMSVLENPSLADRLGKNAREFFETKYSFHMFLKKTEQVLEKAMA